jgi:hypothetical protein
MSTVASPREARSRLALLGHVPGNDGENPAEASQRNVSGEWRGNQHEQQDVDRVQHAGDGTARTRADVGRRARDSAGDAHAAEDHRGDIGCALRDEFAV